MLKDKFMTDNGSERQHRQTAASAPLSCTTVHASGYYGYRDTLCHSVLSGVLNKR